jgi:hypothetical protein
VHNAFDDALCTRLPPLPAASRLLEVHWVACKQLHTKHIGGQHRPQHTQILIFVLFGVNSCCNSNRHSQALQLG